MKNPWMSMWLSAANQAAGKARVYWLAEMRRQQKAFEREMVKAWGLGGTPARKPARKSRGT